MELTALLRSVAVANAPVSSIAVVLGKISNEVDGVRPIGRKSAQNVLSEQLVRNFDASKPDMTSQEGARL